MRLLHLSKNRFKYWFEHLGLAYFQTHNKLLNKSRILCEFFFGQFTAFNNICSELKLFYYSSFQLESDTDMPVLEGAELKRMLRQWWQKLQKIFFLPHGPHKEEETSRNMLANVKKLIASLHKSHGIVQNDSPPSRHAPLGTKT